VDRLILALWSGNHQIDPPVADTLLEFHEKRNPGVMRLLRTEGCLHKKVDIPTPPGVIHSRSEQRYPTILAKMGGGKLEDGGFFSFR
jgi:hypothetical protein